MRLFNLLIFDQVVRGTAELVSPVQFSDVLGRADDLVYEIEVEKRLGLAPKLTVRHLHSNSGNVFIPLSPLISGAVLGDLPYRALRIQSGPLAALGQVGVSLGDSGDVAWVRIWATGRAA